MFSDVVNAVVSEETKQFLESSPEIKKHISDFTNRFNELIHTNAAPKSSSSDLHESKTLISFAPGRINLIGEHVDYLGGNVLPAAIDKGIFSFGTVLDRPPINHKNNNKNEEAEKDDQIMTWTFMCNNGAEVYTFEGNAAFTAGQHYSVVRAVVIDNDDNDNCCGHNHQKQQPHKHPRWVNYVSETLNQIKIPAEHAKCQRLETDPKFILSKKHHRHFYIAVFSTLPVGAGLSSSAAFNISIANLLAGLFDRSPIIRSKKLPPQQLRADAPPFDQNSSDPSNQTAETDYNESLNNEFSAYASRLHLARLAQRTEHCTGTMCGIMDQLASLFGSPATCLLTNCDICQVTPVPLFSSFKLKDSIQFLLINSIVPHELGDAYNLLRASLERAQNALGAFFNTQTFSAVAWAKEELVKVDVAESLSAPRQVSETIGNKLRDIAITDAKASPEDARKLSYVASETVRTILFCKLLQQQTADEKEELRILALLGELLNATHDGLSQILNVSTPELDFIQEFLAKHNYANGGQQEKNDDEVPFRCFGSRMMGGGFGGCVLALVRTKNADVDIQKFMKETKDFMPIFSKKFFPDSQKDHDNFSGVYYKALTGGGATLLC